MSLDALAIRKKRLVHHSRYRGFLESDVILGRFAEDHLASLDEAQVSRYEALLNENDHDIFAWIVGSRPVPPEHDNDVLTMIRQTQLELARSLQGR
jgi:antitoxin CptB